MLELYRAYLQSDDLDEQWMMARMMVAKRGRNKRFLAILQGSPEKDTHQLAQRLVNSKLEDYNWF